jgi:long-chain acyl-CoA synthetase
MIYNNTIQTSIFITARYLKNYFIKTSKNFIFIFHSFPSQITIAFLLHSRLTRLVTSDENTSRYDLSSLKEIFYDGANLIDGIATKAVQKFSLKHIRQVAGQSEIGWVAICPRSLSQPESKSVGLPAPGLEIKITELDTGRTVGPMKIGEIRIKSKHSTKGYLNRPKKLTENLYDKDGFVKTGDAGYYDDKGFLYHVDRVCWLIRCAGNVLIASHLEAIIRGHDSVSEAVVIPVDSEKFGQLPKAFITVKKNCCVNEQEIIEYLNDKIEGSYKNHIRVTVLDQMPISPNGRGRIRKGVLMQMG